MVRADLQPGTTTENPVYIAPTDGTYYLKVIFAQFGHNPPDRTPLEYELEIDLPQKT